MEGVKITHPVNIRVQPLHKHSRNSMEAETKQHQIRMGKLYCLFFCLCVLLALFVAYRIYQNTRPDVLEPYTDTNVVNFDHVEFDRNYLCAVLGRAEYLMVHLLPHQYVLQNEVYKEEHKAKIRQTYLQDNGKLAQPLFLQIVRNVESKISPISTHYQNPRLLEVKLETETVTIAEDTFKVFVSNDAFANNELWTMGLVQLFESLGNLNCSADNVVTTAKWLVIVGHATSVDLTRINKFLPPKDWNNHNKILGGSIRKQKIEDDPRSVNYIPSSLNLDIPTVMEAPLDGFVILSLASAPELLPSTVREEDQLPYHIYLGLESLSQSWFFIDLGDVICHVDPSHKSRRRDGRDISTNRCLEASQICAVKTGFRTTEQLEEATLSPDQGHYSCVLGHELPHFIRNILIIAGGFIAMAYLRFCFNVKTRMLQMEAMYRMKKKSNLSR